MWSTSPRENRSANPVASAPGRYSGARPQCSATNRPGSPTQRASASPPASSLPSLAVGLVGVAIPELPDVGPVEGARVAGVHHHAGVAGAAGGGHVALVEGAGVGDVHHHAGVAGAAGGGHVALVEGAGVGDVHHRPRVPGAAEGGLGLLGGLDLLVPDVLGVRRHGRSFTGWPALRRGPSLSTHVGVPLTPPTKRCFACLDARTPSVPLVRVGGKGCPHGRCPVPAWSSVRQPRDRGRGGLARPGRARPAGRLGRRRRDQQRPEPARDREPAGDRPAGQPLPAPAERQQPGRLPRHQGQDHRLGQQAGGRGLLQGAGQGAACRLGPDPFANAASGLVSKDATTAFTPVLLDIPNGDVTEELADDILDTTEPARKAGVEVSVGGNLGGVLSKSPTESSEVVGLLAAMLILALTFGSLVAMGMPIITAVLGLATALGLIGLLGHLFDIPTVGPTLATMIGLGVGIDYALFLVTKHRDQLARGMERHESIARAVATSGSAIVFAGGTVIIALLSLWVAGIPLVASLGYASAVAVFTAVLAAITLLPAILSLAGRHLFGAKLPAFLRPSGAGGRRPSPPTPWPAGWSPWPCSSP